MRLCKRSVVVTLSRAERVAPAEGFTGAVGATLLNLLLLLAAHQKQLSRLGPELLMTCLWCREGVLVLC